MQPTIVMIAMLLLSIGITLWQIVGSYISFTPDVTAVQVQNFYIHRITWPGLVAVSLQTAVAITLMLVTRR